MHAVRKRILEILKETGGATVAELAAALDMAPVSVRHHLDILQGDSLICVDRLERKGSVGRPQQVYGLTEEANDHFPNDFAALAGHLVRELKQILPPEQVEKAFRSMAGQIAEELDADLASLTMEERLAEVTDFLNARGYLARWEEDGQGGYLLHKHNCPYAGVSGDHPELCVMDKALVDLLMDQVCEKTASMADAELCCTYAIRGDDGDCPTLAAGILVPVDQIQAVVSTS